MEKGKNTYDGSAMHIYGDPDMNFFYPPIDLAFSDPEQYQLLLEKQKEFNKKFWGGIKRALIYNGKIIGKVMIISTADFDDDKNYNFAEIWGNDINRPAFNQPLMRFFMPAIQDIDQYGNPTEEKS